MLTSFQVWYGVHTLAHRFLSPEASTVLVWSPYIARNLSHNRDFWMLVVINLVVCFCLPRSPLFLTSSQTVIAVQDKTLLGVFPGV